MKIDYDLIIGSIISFIILIFMVLLIMLPNINTKSEIEYKNNTGFYTGIFYG